MSDASSTATIKKIKALQKQGQSIVFTNGCYDLIHEGHVQFLKQAKKFGDVLVLGLNSDSSVKRLKGKSRPILKQVERKKILASMRMVDFVCFFNELTPLKLIKKIKPDVLVKGGDWKLKNIVGASFVQKNGGKVVSGIFVRGRSTSQIIKQILTTCK